MGSKKFQLTLPVTRNSYAPENNKLEISEFCTSMRVKKEIFDEQRAEKLTD